ncbi:MAG TPA: type 4a pilus biogenesis protein PilO [Acidiferrobacterales bacterium]|nr:type 4a pilus biogenesis protein PilO [Acidiferrobacterales bacterium]
MTLDDLKNIDLKSIDIRNLAAAPLPIKLIGILLVCIGLILVGYWFIISDQLDAYAELQKKEQGLRETYLNKKALAINLSAYKLQMEEMHQTFGTMLRQLPNTNEVPDLLIDITQAGLGRGLEFILFKPEKEKPIDFYAELPIHLTVSGSYHELGQFVSDVAALPRIVTLSEISIGGGSDKSNKLTMSALAKTYRYVEVEAPKIEAPKSGK